MQLIYNGDTYTVDPGVHSGVHELCVYAVPREYRADGLFISMTRMGDVAHVPASRTAETTLLLRAQLDERGITLEYMNEAVHLIH